MLHTTKIIIKTIVLGLRKCMNVSLVFGFIAIVIALPAQATIAEGTIGWTYVDRAGLSFAPSPMAACNGFRVVGGWSGMISMAAHPGSNGLIYNCRLKPVPFSAANQPIVWSTGLRCGSGYEPQFPGVCVKRVAKVENRIPSLPPASMECSPSNPGFALGNPVILTEGAKIQQDRDYIGNQRGTLEIGRTYRYTRNAVNAPTAGILWSFSFERQFLAEEAAAGAPPPRISIVNSDGSSIRFNRSGLVYTTEVASADSVYALTPKYNEWVYKHSSGRLEYFKKEKSKYLLMSVTRKDGDGTYFSYDENEKLNTISDSFGRTLNVLWHDDYAIASISSPEVSLQYQYEQLKSDDGAVVSAMQRIVNVQINGADGVSQGSKQYHYGEGWPGWFYLTGITDENGVRFATYSYDAEGRVRRSEHAGGAQRHDFSYPTDTSRVVIDPLGAARSITLAPVAGQLRVTSFSQPGGSGCGPAASAYTYSAKGMLQSRSDFSSVKTCFTYETARNLEISHVDGVPAVAACPTASSAPAVGQRKTTRRWHPDWAIETMIAEPLKVTNYIYNGQPDIDGDIASCGDGGTLPDGKPIAVLCKKIESATTDANGAAGFDATKTGAPRITTYSYNRVGQMLSSTISGRAGSGGDTTRYEYYGETTSSHTRGDLAKVTGPTGQIREFLEYTGSGLATKIKEPNGQLIELSYDARQRLISRVVSAFGVGEQATRYHCDLVGQLTGVDLPDSSHIAYRYDDAHRMTDITDTLGNTVHYSLDPMGNRVREEVLDSTGKLTRQIVRIYDALNRIQAVTEGEL